MYTLIEIALSVGVLVTLITALTACVCGCKNSNQKSELVGTAGVVKIRFDEEAPSPAPTTPASIKRASTQNSQRSLPEIPQPVGRHDSGDTASEIYATVNLDAGNKVAAEASTSRDHAYEHAYAKLQNENHNVTVEITPEQREDEIAIDERDASQSGPESSVISARVAISGALPSSRELPYITPPSPRHAQHFSGDSTDSAKGYTSISVREPLSNIRALAQPAPAQHNYATVSDDSDEMYAAIEEAAAGSGSDTYAQIPERRRPARTTPEPELQARARRSAPPEVGASTTNATHSRQASSSSCSNSTGALGSPKPEKRQANSPLPPPPPAMPAHATHATHAAHATHATHVAHATHAGHATHVAHSAHQRISSTGDLFNNDKLRRSLNEKHQRNNSCVSSSDFYGCNYPVDQHRFSSGDLVRPLQAKELNFDIDRPAEHEREHEREREHTADSPARNLDDMYAKVIKKNKGKTDDPPRKTKDPPSDADPPAKYRADDPGYETIDRKKSNHGYETITRKERTISQNQDPGYETVKDIGKSAPNSNFANNNTLSKLNLADSGPNSIIGSDAGYERISKMDNSASDSEPNYEVLRNAPPTPPYATIASLQPQPTYSTVTKRDKYDWPNNNGHRPDPNYESMPHDPLYRGSGSESDPNYESVRPKDPNYDDVLPTRNSNYDDVRPTRDPNYESLRLKDPKYESVRSKVSKSDSLRSKKDPNYESVKYFELPKKEPPYEELNSKAASAGAGAGAGVQRSDSAGYERVARGASNGTDAVGDYFQV